MTTESYIGRGFEHSIEVWYGEYRLIPAPLVEWTEEYDHDDSNKARTLKTQRIKLDGTFYIAGGTYERMFEMQESLRTAFSVDGYEFKIVAGAGNATLPSGAYIASGIYPQIQSVNIEPDLQFNRVDYTVDFVVSTGSVSGQAVTDLTDTWELKEAQDGWYIDVSHTVSARGINTLSSGTNAVHQAIAAVTPLLGISKFPYYLPQYTEPTASGGATINQYEIGVNRTEQIDTLGGGYSVTETFLISSGTNSYVHNQTATFEEDESSIASVTLQGSVRGAGRTNYNQDGGVGFTNALNGFNSDIKPNLPSDASGVYVQYKINAANHYLYTTNSLNFSVSESLYAGSVQYSIRYNDDPSKNLPSGILEATTSVQRMEATRLQSSHVIPFRKLGNVIQDIKTPTEGQVVITSSAKAENTGDATIDTNRAIEQVESEINRVRPNSVDFETLRVSNLQQDYSDKELTAQANITYIFTVSLDSTPTVDSDITLSSI